MRGLKRFLIRLRKVATRRRGDERLREEIETHLAMLSEENIRAGMSPAEARRQARIKFGSTQALREQCRAEEGLPVIENLLYDTRFALRQLRKAPVFTMTAIFTVALGIAALTTVATWTNAVLFDPWPQVTDVRSLRFIDATVLGGQGYSVHYDQLQYIRKSNHSFRDAAAFANTQLNLNSTNAQPEVISAGIVSSNYFHLLGIKPQLGRLFPPNANDRAYGAYDEVVLSDALWRGRFDANPGLIGRTIYINQHLFTVIGIAPRGFLGIFGGIAEGAWVPLSSLRDLSPDAPPDPAKTYGLQVGVRLRPGVHDTIAAAELHTLARVFAAEQHYNGWDLNLRDCSHFERGLFYGITEQLPMLAGASVLLMVLVCINIASLLGQHAARRRREVAIRTALGAAPGRIASQMFVETGILAASGALAGWIASLGLSKALYLMLPNFGFPVAFNLQNDWRTDTLAAVLAVLVTLVCGLGPLRQSLRISQREALHEGGAAVTGAARNRTGQITLLGLQLGICFMVLVCCGLLTRTAMNIFHCEPGFDPRNTLTATIDLSRSGYSEDRALVFLTALLYRLGNEPGVLSATLTTHLPMGDNGSNNTRNFGISGYVPAKGEDMEVVTDFDGPDFFRTMGIPLLHGRDFRLADNSTSPKVAVINEAMAHRYWPKGNALGSQIVVDKIERQIVGVVPNFAYQRPNDLDPSPVVFLPYLQGSSGYGYAIVAMRSRTTAATVAGELRRTLAALDRGLPLEQVRSLEKVIDEQYQSSRVPAELLAVYAVASLLVAIMGLYAVMAYSVTERNREFALRIALGSTRERIFRLVLRGSTRVTLVAIITGGVGSVPAVRLLRSVLFGVSPFDPVSYCAAAVLLLLTVFVSGLAPAHRAASADPIQSLRSE